MVVEGLGAWFGIEHEVDEGGGIFGELVGMVFGELVGIENEVGRKVLVDLFGARWPTGQVLVCKVLGDLVVIVLGELVGIEHEVGGKVIGDLVGAGRWPAGQDRGNGPRCPAAQYLS